MDRRNDIVIINSRIDMNDGVRTPVMTSVIRPMLR